MLVISKGVFSRDNLPRIKEEACVYAINLSDKQSKEIHWVSLFFNKNTDVCIIKQKQR